MYIKKILLITIMVCIPTSLYAGNVYYIPEGTIKEQLRERIECTRQSLDICIHDFAAVEIEKYLEVARDRGVRVRIVILELGNTTKGPLTETLIHKGFNVRVLKPQFVDDPVNDFLVMDNTVLVTGVYNWLAYRNRNICNDVLFLYDFERIRSYKDLFYRLFAEGEPIPFPGDRKELTAFSTLPVADNAAPKQPLHPDSPMKQDLTNTELTKPVHEAISRDFIDISFEELDKQFGKGSMLSRSEKNKLWKKYRGKYVRWRGIVSYKGMGRVDWNRMGVSRQLSHDVEVEILFDWKQFEKVMDVKVGNEITYTGKLVSRPVINAPYRLDDGDIE